MKISKVLYLSALLGVVLSLPSCSNRSNDDVWEDTKSAGRHIQRGFKTLGGKQGNSRQINSKDQFAGIQDEDCVFEGNDGNNPSYYNDACNLGYADSPCPYDANDDFVAINDPEGQLQSRDGGARAPRETPGEAGSSIPGIESFQDPATNSEWASVFIPIYFAYDSYLVKGQQNINVIHAISSYLRNHPNIYLFIEGHADERGPQAYNLALSSRRANAVRNMLVSEGISPDRLFTLAYGKERPVVLEHHEEAWSKNRRAEFKVYDR